MSVPLKPWEVAMAGSFPSSTPYIPNNNTNRLLSSAIPYPGNGGGGFVTNQHPSTSGNPPPLPARANQTRPIYSSYNRSAMMPYSNYGGYNNPYSSGYPSSSFGYSSYGSMGGMGGAYGSRPYGFGNNVTPFGPMNELSFSQMAEESASPAFQSIESFVGAFCSISSMMESTFHALYSSFRAVIGVADHLGRVKQILSALSIFRFFKWVFRRFIYLIGISKIKPADVESLWNNLSTADASQDPSELFLQPDLNKPSSWPILMFLGFIFAGPYLMWKLVKSLQMDPPNKDKRKWASGESEHFIAAAEYSFEPMNDRELELKSGQIIRLAPAKFQPRDVKGWVLASDGFKIGLVPTNYIKIKGKKANDPRPLYQPNTANSSPERRVNTTQFEKNASERPESTAEQIMYSTPPDAGGISSDDDTETLVGDAIDE